MYRVGDPQPVDDRDARPAAALVAFTSLCGDIEAMLCAVGPNLGNRELLVLPPYQRGGHSFYGEDDVDAVRLARRVGINAAFLHMSEDREYLHEYAAGYVVEFAIALSANVAAIGLTPLVDYVIARARQAINHGLHEGPDKEVPVKMTVAHLRRDRNGATSIKGLRIEGPAGGAAEALRILLDPQNPALESAPEATPGDAKNGAPAIHSKEKDLDGQDSK